MHLRRLFEEDNYDTLTNLLNFYDHYQQSGKGFVEFWKSYSPTLTPGRHTCVGLALELWRQLQDLNEKFPNLSCHFQLVSCEENIESAITYASWCERIESVSNILEKEHVLLCLKFDINGRAGVALCDPGYHVARVITVMSDRQYPHTGWFLQSEDNAITKEYNYQMVAEHSIEWNEKTTRNGVQKNFTGLIYVGRPYMTALDVTERRNLVYDFRSLISRDQKGHLIAGVYFKIEVDGDDFTIFYQDMGKQRVNLKFSALEDDVQIKGKTKNIITICNEQLNLPDGALFNMLRRTGQMMRNTDFLREILRINECIKLLSADN